MGTLGQLLAFLGLLAAAAACSRSGSRSRSLVFTHDDLDLANTFSPPKNTMTLVTNFTLRSLDSLTLKTLPKALRTQVSTAKVQ